MINTRHNITYNDASIFEKFKVFKDEEKEQLKDIIYKYDLIIIFELQDFLEDIINQKIIDLYDKMITVNEIEQLSAKLTQLFNDSYYNDNNNNNNDNMQEHRVNLTGFIMLFSFDNLHLFYPCICEFLDKGEINFEKIETLKNNIF